MTGLSEMAPGDTNVGSRPTGLDNVLVEGRQRLRPVDLRAVHLHPRIVGTITIDQEIGLAELSIGVEH